MKQVNNYILLVDSHKPKEYCHDTKGRYRVGAKTEKEAVSLLREFIKFGSIQVYYKCMDEDVSLKYKEIKKEC